MFYPWSQEVLEYFFALYPNPARNQLYIQYNSPDQLDFNVQIVNAQGKIVYPAKAIESKTKPIQSICQLLCRAFTL